MRNKKENIIIAIVSIAIVLGATVYFSYAFFATTGNYNSNLNMSITLPNGIVANFTAITGTAGSMSINGVNLLEGGKGSIAASNTFGLTIELQTPDIVSCSYQLEWIWISGGYTKTTSSSNEYTVQGTSTGVSVGQTQVPNSPNSALLGTYSICANNTTTSRAWIFTQKFYNMNEVQDAHVGKTYVGRVQVKSGSVSCSAASSC